ncbi:FecR family protein [Alteriqipengyuania lutimaris]|uniref:Tetratricopeptide repeat protein n=1 Tax=Alteriqipengyuania lutimaris TaxID=1538146 RepID=A0A395LNI7_9SPHN|nr:hypothetical protein [Alteriqipengyuania lutimaris]MBB3032459.1 putative negative regulator of RcsB-dependent stress response [Alteriqipengyuania lutimaris]RDS78401.1 hypothetical protein DL238_12840 [Alteriqipengyuania lutimaris]
MRKLVSLTASLSLALGASAVAEDGPDHDHGETNATAEPGGETGSDVDSRSEMNAQEHVRAPAVRLPGFAAALANDPPIQSAAGWRIMPERDAWKAIASSTPATRQQARWAYARSLIGKGRSPEAYGVLVAMAQDDPDLSLVAAHRLALGAALVGLGRHTDALDALSADQLADNAEACAWRLRALAALAMNAAALGEWSCARPPIAARDGKQRAPFVLAAAEAALETGNPRSALKVLRSVSDADAAANLLRGRALFALGSEQKARLRLDRAADNGTPEQRMDARVSVLEGLVAHHHADPRKAAAELERIGYSWRGGSVERRALKLRFTLAEAAGDDRAMLTAGAALLRYHSMADDSGALLGALQQKLGAILSPGSKVPLPEAAGLFWDYRDLSPSGAGGDLLVSRLADRLQAAGLYERAAGLLDYQLMARAKDVAQGPLSVRVAKLYILAEQPEEALRALRATDGNIYPDPMLWARLRIEAVALHKLGRTEEALAVLDGVPEGGAIRDEIEWGRRNWKALSASGDLPAVAGGRLSEVEQTIILRRAIALAMLGRETSLARLRTRYANAFVGEPTAAAFDLLTGPVDGLDSTTVAQAMAAMPDASPAGDIADLLAGARTKGKPVTS